MKKIGLLFLVILNSVIGFAQWQQNGDNIYYNSGNVSIGTNITDNKFEVLDNNSHFVVNEKYSPTWQSYRAIMGIGYLGNGHAGIMIDGVDGDFVGMDYCSLIQFNDRHLELSNKSDSQIDFGVGGYYFSPEHIKMSILHTGNVGIGTQTPEAKLQIADGDIYISDINKGIIMKSPDGQCWRGTLNNTGTLQFSEITCPEVTVSNTPTPESFYDINVFPNPTDNQVEIVVENKNHQSLNLQIIDFSGKVVKSQEINKSHTSISINDLKSGIYLFNIFDTNGNKVYTEKVIKS